MAPASLFRATRTPKQRLHPKGSSEDKLVASLISLLKAGTTPWRREWDTTASGHHVNLLSGRRYRGANPVLLTLGMHLRGSALPYWCGFTEAKAMGLAPRKGSKAVHVLRPQVHRQEGSRLPEPSAPDSGGTAGAGEGKPGAGPERSWVSYRAVPVFNAVDLTGEALQALILKRRQAEGASLRPEPERLAAAEAVLAAWPVPVLQGGSNACYIPSADHIHLPERAAFSSATAFYATWGHEAIHSTGHSSRLARDLAGVMGSASYAREELVAELGTVLLGDRLEIGSDVANHAAYLASWISLLQESPRVLLQVLGDARRAADLICSEGQDQA